MKISKTYRLIADKNLTMHMPVEGQASKDIQFKVCTMYDHTGQYTTSDKNEQKWLESLNSFGRLYTLENEVDVSDAIHPADYEAPVFQNEETEVIEFPNFNAAKKYAIDTFGVDAKSVRNIGLLEPFLREHGVAFKIG